MILSWCLLASFSLNAHTFHEGITDISYNPNTGNMEIVQHFTTHDFEIMLAEQLQLKVTADQKNYEALVRNYTQQHFSISSNNQTIELTWLGIEAGINQTIIYQEIQQTPSITGLLLYNQMLIDFFPDQINRLNYNDSKNRLSLIFTKTQLQQPLKVTIIKKSNSL